MYFQVHSRPFNLALKTTYKQLFLISKYKQSKKTSFKIKNLDDFQKNHQSNNNQIKKTSNIKGLRDVPLIDAVNISNKNTKLQKHLRRCTAHINPKNENKPI
jgi:hypothetical protein